MELQNIYKHWKSSLIVIVAAVLWILNQIGLAYGMYDEAIFETIKDSIPVGVIFIAGLLYGPKALKT